MMKYIIMILLLASTLQAGPYEIPQDLNEQELCSLYVDMLAKFSRYAEGMWHESAPNAGYWGNGISGGNEGIRAVANTALVYAVLSKKTDALDADKQKLYMDRAIAGIRYCAESHLTGARKCVDGKQWGNSWQSTMWAGNVGFAAWLLWHDLDGDLRKTVKRVVSYEADRFLDRKPPGNRWGNTVAEEVGWDQILISLAPNMFPESPNAAKWKEKSIEYMMNTVSVPRDLKDERIVDGRPVKDWVCAVNSHPDFTMENHGFIHPSYIMVSPAEVGQGAFFYALAGNPIPEAAGNHLMDNWRFLQTIMLPHGYWAFTQGMDWALNSDGHIHYLAWLATYAKDPLAAGMEKLVAQYVAGHQAVHGDTFAGPSSRLGFAREAIVAERLSYAYMYHKLLGAVDSGQTIRQASYLKSVRRFNFVDVTMHRTGSKFASFSWKNRVMGLVMPIGAGHEDNPYFVTPLTNGLVGSFALGQAGSGTRVVERTWRKTTDGFETEGILLINGGLLRQEIEFVSAGEKAVVYMDRVTAVSDVTVNKEIGVPIGIENDEFTGDSRTLYHQDGSQIITGPDTEQLIRIPGKWANVDGRLGIVMVAGSGLAYLDVGAYNRDGAREDTLFGSYSDAPREFKAGEEIARRVIVLLTETSPQDTAELAEKPSSAGILPANL